MEILVRLLLLAITAALLGAGLFGQNAIHTLHVFTGGHDGVYPASPLTQVKGGDYIGGAGGDFLSPPNGGGKLLFCGNNLVLGSSTIYRMTPAGEVVTIYRFPDDGSQGFTPNSVVQAGDGDYYGTTYFCGDAKSNGGTIFKLTSDGTFVTLHVFRGPDGLNPVGQLVEAGDGRLYGVTLLGGASGGGVIYRIDRRGNYEIVHSFNVTDGFSPSGGLVLDDCGNFYGVTSGGGNKGGGVIYKLSAGASLTVLHNFDSNTGASSPLGPVSFIDGNLYGVTFYGPGFEAGTFFTISPDGGFKQLASFGGFVQPITGLTLASDCNFYGITANGGVNGGGSIFRANPFGDLHSFSFPDDARALPYNPLIQAEDGGLVGVSLFGGPFDAGTAYELAIDLRPPAIATARPAVTIRCEHNANQVLAKKPKCHTE